MYDIQDICKQARHKFELPLICPQRAFVRPGTWIFLQKSQSQFMVEHERDLLPRYGAKSRIDLRWHNKSRRIGLICPIGTTNTLFLQITPWNKRPILRFDYQYLHIWHGSLE